MGFQTGSHLNQQSLNLRYCWLLVERLFLLFTFMLSREVKMFEAKLSLSQSITLHVIFSVVECESGQRIIKHCTIVYMF